MVLAFPTDKLGKDLLSRAKAAGPVKEEEANELLELVVSNGIASAAAGETSMLADTNAHGLLRRLRAPASRTGSSTTSCDGSAERRRRCRPSRAMTTRFSWTSFPRKVALAARASSSIPI